MRLAYLLPVLALTACAGAGTPPPDDAPAVAASEPATAIGTITATVDGARIEVPTLDRTPDVAEVTAFFSDRAGRPELSIVGFLPGALEAGTPGMVALTGGLPSFPEPGPMTYTLISVQVPPFDLSSPGEVVVEALELPTEAGDYGRASGRFNGRICPTPVAEVVFLVDPCRDVEGRFDTLIAILGVEG